MMILIELIADAPWREVITHRESWPHEYVLLHKNGRRQLFITGSCFKQASWPIKYPRAIRLREDLTGKGTKEDDQ